MRARAPLFGVLAAVLLAVAFFFFLYKPKADEQAALEAETAQLESQAAQLESQIAQLEEIEANEMEIRAALTRLEEFIPIGTVAQPTALRQFQLAADAAGVEIREVAFEQPVLVEGAPEAGDPDTALTQVGVTMTVEGGYFQIVDLLRRLEVDVPRALLVESVSAVEGEAGFPSLATTVLGDLFAVVPVTAEPAPPVTPGVEGAAPAPGQTPAPGTAPAPGTTPAPGASPEPNPESS